MNHQQLQSCEYYILLRMVIGNYFTMMEHELVSSNLKTKEVDRHHTKVGIGMRNNINVARNGAV